MTLIVLVMLLSLVSNIFDPGASSLALATDSPQCRRWVDSVYNSLDERQRVAQLMVPNVTPAQGKASEATISKLVKDYQVGGLLFSEGSLNQYAAMTNYAQSLARLPLLMTLDGEWGLSMRVPEAPRFPYNMGLGAIQNDDLLYDYGREMARECRAMGIQVNFAPVLDVNSNPANPVIGYRSFGEDPERVAALGLAYSRGLEDGGVMAVAKHFPGHGDTNVDSHKALPVVNHSRAQLNASDLLPFKKFSDARMGGVMIGHISVPALDATGTPASLSEPITTGVLRNEFGFEGLIYTDGLGMKGADVAHGKNVCVEALKAGADVLLCPRNTGKDIEAVLKAVNDGELSNSVIEDRCKRVLAYKYALGLTAKPWVDTAAADSVLNNYQADDINRRLADASLTVLSNADNILPLGNLATTSIAVVRIGTDKATEFEKMIQRYAKVDIYDGNNITANELSDINAHDVVIAGVYNDNEASRRALSKLDGAKSLISVFFMNPYKMAKFRKSLGYAKALVLAYDNTLYTQQAAGKGLFGGINVDGRLPVNLNGIAPIGTGVKLSKTRLGFASLTEAGLDERLDEQIDSLVYQALEDGAFPGCQVLVAKGGNIVFNRNYGNITKGGPEVTENTLYDLASVSKTVGTLPGVMKAYDLGLFEMDEPASKIIPGMRTPSKEDVTPRMLLYHETGIAPSLNLFDIMIDSTSYTGKLLSPRRDRLHPIKIYNNLYGQRGVRLRRDITSPHRTDVDTIEAAKGIWIGQACIDTIMGRIYNSQPRSNRNYAYSCLNFSLLMDLEQRVTGQKHDKWVTDSIWGPIGAYGFRYQPTMHDDGREIAYTENDTYLRKQHLHGYVHDELAAFSGGLQGNAGVFGTALDVAKLCQLWLNNGTYGDAHVYTPDTSLLFTTSKSENSRRGLGFDKPDINNLDNSPCCDEAGANVYGHTGYTGTVYWVDPDEDMIYVFLSNRVDPTRDNSSPVRARVNSLIYKAIKK